MMPAFSEENGSPVLSVMGSASMSPRSATTGADRSRPGTRATSPVPATRATSVMPNDASAATSLFAVSVSCHESSGCRCRSRRSSTRRRAASWEKWLATAGGRAMSSIAVLTRCSLGGQSLCAHGEIVYASDIDGDTDPWLVARHAHDPIVAHRPLRRHDIILPVARAGTQVSRDAEPREGRERHVVRAADTALEHPAAPDGDLVLHAEIVNRARLRKSTDAPRLDVDDAAGTERDHVFGLFDTGDRLVEADRRLQHPLELGVPNDVVECGRLLDHDEIEVVELLQAIGVGPVS